MGFKDQIKCGNGYQGHIEANEESSEGYQENEVRAALIILLLSLSAQKGSRH